MNDCLSSPAHTHCRTAGIHDAYRSGPQDVPFEQRDGYRCLQGLADHIDQIPEGHQSSGMREFMRLFLSFQQDLKRAYTQSMLNALEAKYEQLIKAAEKIEAEASDMQEAAITSASLGMTAACVQVGVAIASCHMNQQATAAQKEAAQLKESACRLENQAGRPQAPDQAPAHHAQEQYSCRQRASGYRTEAAQLKETAGLRAARANKWDLYAHAVRAGGQSLAEMSQVQTNMDAAEDRRDQNEYQAQAARTEALLGTVSQAEQSSLQASGAAIQTLQDCLREEREAARAAANIS